MCMFITYFILGNKQLCRFVCEKGTAKKKKKTPSVYDFYMWKKHFDKKKLNKKNLG